MLDGEKILAHHFEEMARGHAEALAPMVRRRDGAKRASVLPRWTVSPSPPGPAPSPASASAWPSCAGLRVALKKPLIGVTTLEAMAAATQSPRAAAIHDAKRDEAYLLLWEKGETVLAPAVMPFAEAVEKIRGFGPCALAGTGAPAAASALGRGFSAQRYPPARCAVGGAAGADAPGA